MNCPKCKNKASLLKQFDVVLTGMFECSSCSYRIDIEPNRSSIMDWIIEVVLFICVFLLAFLFKLSFAGILFTLFLSFVAWFFYKHRKIKMILLGKDRDISNLKQSE